MKGFWIWERLRRCYTMAIPTDLESQINAERSQTYQGRTKVPIHILLFESDNQMGSHPLDPKNVTRLLRIFQLEECFHLESEHHVSVLINIQVLNTVLSDARLQSEDLMICENPSKLNINISLFCLHEKHWLKAANEFLDPHDKWWVIDLYLDGLSSKNQKSIGQELTSVCRYWSLFESGHQEEILKFQEFLWWWYLPELTVSPAA